MGCIELAARDRERKTKQGRRTSRGYPPDAETRSQQIRICSNSSKLRYY